MKPDWGDFDPLTWMIEVTIKRIEFHAGLTVPLNTSGDPNSTKQSLLNSLSDTHYARRHPDWVYYFNRQIYLDPGVPEVREFIVQTVMEVVQNYAIDAVHLMITSIRIHMKQKLMDSQRSLALLMKVRLCDL